MALISSAAAEISRLTGGTGRFEGISGGGPVTIRAAFADDGETSESKRQAGSGIIFWPALHFSLS